MKSQLILSAMLVVGLSAMRVYGQQKQISSPLKALLNPQIIATVNLQHQLEPIPIAILFVSEADGLFRITTHFGTSRSRQEPAYMQIYWAATERGIAKMGIANILPSYSRVPNTIVIQVKAGRIVYYSTYVHLSYETIPSPTYDVFATVERLQ
jgi:hypothetical protein